MKNIALDLLNDILGMDFENLFFKDIVSLKLKSADLLDLFDSGAQNEKRPHRETLRNFISVTDIVYGFINNPWRQSLDFYDDGIRALKSVNTNITEKFLFQHHQTDNTFGVIVFTPEYSDFRTWKTGIENFRDFLQDYYDTVLDESKTLKIMQKSILGPCKLNENEAVIKEFYGYEYIKVQDQRLYYTEISIHNWELSYTRNKSLPVKECLDNQYSFLVKKVYPELFL
jgi:hypothetical protein